MPHNSSFLQHVCHAVVFYISYLFTMKRSPLLVIVILSTVFLSACSSSDSGTDADINTNTLDPSASVIQEQALEEIPARAIETPTASDHHEGEVNVVPHAETPEVEDHHDGESNVAPHDDTADHDDSGQAPHRH